MGLLDQKGNAMRVERTEEKVEDQKLSKICPKCKTEVLFTDYTKNISRSTGLGVYCKKCERSRRDYSDVHKRNMEINPEHMRARRNLRSQVCKGRIIKSLTCEICGVKCITEGHHKDYSKPYDVIWLCTKCHRDNHLPNAVAKALIALKKGQ